MSHSDPDVRRLMRAQKRVKGATTELKRLETARVSTGDSIRLLENVSHVIGREIASSIEYFNSLRAK